MTTRPNDIIIFDTTLRDGEQAPGAAMTIPEKVRIARQLARLGVDVIEAGFPVSSPAQFTAVERIASEVDGPVTCALARTTERDIDSAGEALKSGSRTRIHTFIATSAIHIEAKFSDDRFGYSMAEKRSNIIRMAVESVKQAKSYTSDVEFSAEDAGRTDPGFLCEIVQAVIEAGATTVNIPDTTGYCVPSEYAALIRTVLDGAGRPDDVVFSTHCHDDLGMAVANSLAGVRAGARQIECTVNGIGERAGNAALEEVVMALEVRGDRFGTKSNIRTRHLSDTSRLVSVCSGFPVQPNKAVVGKNAFSHEAGIHQHGVLKKRETYEIMRAEDVGHVSEQIRLGRHSGRHGLFSRLEHLGFSVDESDRADVYERFVELADRKKEVYEEDLYRLMNETPPRPEADMYRLLNLSVQVSTPEKPRATLKVENRSSGAQAESTATGDGPVDAIYRAINHAVAQGHELVDYSIRSVSTGADAQGEVVVVVENAGSSFSGKAVDTDVLQASAVAYINALNKLAAHRTQSDSVQFVNDGIMNAFGAVLPQNGKAEQNGQVDKKGTVNW